MLHRLTHEALNDPTKRAALLDDLRTLPGKLAKDVYKRQIFSSSKATATGPCT